jgi:hypothetical protein
MLTKRDEGGLVAFDDLATGLESGAISRGSAIKLAGAALAASALGLFASRGADAQTVTPEITARKCRKKGGDFCHRSGHRICCGAGGRRRKACCGPDGAACCSKNQRCDRGKCKNHR